MTNCECPGPGLCRRFERAMGLRDWELCSGQCPPERPCPDAATLAAYRALWAVQAGLPTPKPRGPCGHLGGPTGERRSCPSCKGRVEVKLMACAVHGHCAVAKRVEGVACCVGCLDHTEAIPPEFP